jgi:hypothetical protein
MWNDRWVVTETKAEAVRSLSQSHISLLKDQNELATGRPHCGTEIPEQSGKVQVSLGLVRRNQNKPMGSYSNSIQIPPTSSHIAPSWISRKCGYEQTAVALHGGRSRDEYRYRPWFATAAGSSVFLPENTGSRLWTKKTKRKNLEKTYSNATRKFWRALAKSRPRFTEVISLQDIRRSVQPCYQLFLESLCWFGCRHHGTPTRFLWASQF